MRGWFTQTRQRMKELEIVDDQDMKVIADSLNSVEITTEETADTVINPALNGRQAKTDITADKVDAALAPARK